jgi:hypothetical protein
MLAVFRAFPLGREANAEGFENRVCGYLGGDELRR